MCHASNIFEDYIPSKKASKEEVWQYSDDIIFLHVLETIVSMLLFFFFFLFFFSPKIRFVLLVTWCHFTL